MERKIDGERCVFVLSCLHQHTRRRSSIDPPPTQPPLPTHPHPHTPSYCVHKRGQSFTMISRNRRPARQEYYNHFAHVFAENLLAEDCTYREREYVDVGGCRVRFVRDPFGHLSPDFGPPLPPLRQPPLYIYILGVLDGEVVAIHKQSGEHEAFGHNKTVAINKAVRVYSGFVCLSKNEARGVRVVTRVSDQLWMEHSLHSHPTCLTIPSVPSPQRRRHSAARRHRPRSVTRSCTYTITNVHHIHAL